MFTNWPSIPGSRRSSSDEPADPSPAGLSSGRFSDAQLTLLGELLAWWQNRRALGDSSSNPLGTLIGGVDLRGTCTTTGAAAVAATWSDQLVPPPGCSLLVHAIGVPDQPAVIGEVYSLVGLCHFYLDGSTWLSRYTTVARLPTTATTEIRAALTGPPPGDTPVVQIVGVAGQTIGWTLNALSIEL